VKQFLLVLGAAALLVAPRCAQAQTTQKKTAQVQGSQVENAMTASELRQVFMDLGSYLDARRGTNLRSQFAAVPDDIMMRISQAIPDARRFQNAVAVLKRDDAARAASTRRMQKASTPSILGAPPYTPVYTEPVYPDCPYGTIIDDAPWSQCNPGYPDPTNSAWLTEVSGPAILGAFDPSDDYHISPQSCSLEIAAAMSVAANTLQATIMVYTAVCGALPDGAGNVCWATNAPFSIAAGYVLADNNACVFQGGLVTGAQVEAAFHNTVTNYNSLKGLSTQLANVDTHIANEFVAHDNHLTGVDVHIAAEFAALDAHMVTLINQLVDANVQSTALLRAYLRQLLRMQLIPDTQKSIPAALLSCTGTNCPAILTNCPKAGCSWLNP